MPEITRLQTENELISRLLSDPQPGLSTWREALRAAWVRFGQEAWENEDRIRKEAVARLDHRAALEAMENAAHGARRAEEQVRRHAATRAIDRAFLLHVLRDAAIAALVLSCLPFAWLLAGKATPWHAVVPALFILVAFAFHVFLLRARRKRDEAVRGSS